MSNFASVLDRPATEIERPKPLPVGTYLCILKGMPRYDKSAKKGTDFVEFTAVPQSALDDVNAEELANAGGLADKTIRMTYYLTDDAAWRLKKFLEDLKFDVEDPGVTMRQMIEESANNEIYVTMRHKPSQDGKSVFAEVADTARVD